MTTYGLAPERYVWLTAPHTHHAHLVASDQRLWSACGHPALRRRDNPVAWRTIRHGDGVCRDCRKRASRPPLAGRVLLLALQPLAVLCPHSAFVVSQWTRGRCCLTCCAQWSAKPDPATPIGQFLRTYALTGGRISSPPDTP